MSDDGAEVGVCDLCGQEMIRTADDCWHPYDVTVTCPPQPADPKMSTPESFAEWQAFYASGLRPGRPGREHWRPAVSAPQQIPPARPHGGGSTIIVTEPPPPPPVHPCLLGQHRWAYLTSGGQACGYCGTPRR